MRPNYKLTIIDHGNSNRGWFNVWWIEKPYKPGVTGIGGGPIAVMKFEGTGVEIFDPRMTVHSNEPEFEHEIIDFHHPESFDRLDKKLKRMKEICYPKAPKTS